MTKSMTGFGRGTSEGKERLFILEIRSVNHKYLDLNIRMPRNLLALEEKIRNVINKEVSRGKVDVYINLDNYSKTDVITEFNKSLGDSYVECLRQIRDAYSLKDDISVSLLAKFPDVITIKQKEEDIDCIWEDLSLALNEALTMFISMREKEGLKLEEDILRRCEVIKTFTDRIELASPNEVKDYTNRLNSKLKELLDNPKLDENRVAMEIAIYADKVSIDEEIVRLNSHICQMKETIKLNQPIGRKLDFIVQEMNREVNTIASKSNNLDIINNVLNIKNEIEKIREQIQNIE